MERALVQPVRPPTVLLVEDDPNDPWLLRRALLRVAPAVELRVITDGRSAVDHLEPLGSGFAPALLLLDIHLPRLSGWDVLRWVKGRAAFGTVPVLMWTSLPTPEGAERSRAMGAAGYYSKPQTASGFLQLASAVCAHLGD
jgi:CheY-like chemotaxis protein